MADKAISELPLSQGMTDDALLVVYQNGATESIEGRLIKGYAQEATAQFVETAEKFALISEKSAGAAKRAETAAETAWRNTEVVAIRTPYVGEHGRWMVWDLAAGAFRDSGVAARGAVGPRGDTGETGPRGPVGPKGTDGVLTELGTGIFAMGISEDGHLLVSVNETEAAPPLAIDPASGHLLYQIN